MDKERKYTKRVKMEPDGTYIWKSRIRLDPDKEGHRLILIVCMVVCVLTIGFCAIISVDFMISILPVIIGSAAAAILLYILAGKLGESFVFRYEMNDSYIKIVDLKVPVTYHYDKISEIVVTPLHLELHENTNSSKIYVPQEDFLFVKDYIVNHTMGHAEIRYERYGMSL